MENMQHEHHMHEQKVGVKKFLPLIVIFILIALFTLFMTLTNPGADVRFAMQMFMAGFFLVFGFFKTLKWSTFAEAYSSYDLVAMKSRLYAYAYPAIEIGLGLAYFFGWRLYTINIVTLVLMLISALGVYIALRKKEEIVCACLGTVFNIPMTKVTLFEDLLMALMAFIMLV